MERIKNAVEKIVERVPAVRGKGEEATKQALVLPLLDALGYDIWDPSEVCPEWEADFAVKKAGQKEKVDLAVFLNSVARIYFEVKSVECSLDGHEGQLARYFNASPSVSLAVLTNGVEYRFYSDTAEMNLMDTQPFHIARFDALDQGLDVLVRFQKSVFSADAIRDYARELNYTARIVEFLRAQLDLKDREPSEDFVRWILSREKISEKKVTASVVEVFSPIAKSALQVVLRDIVRRSFAAVENEVGASTKRADEIPLAAVAMPEKSAEISPEDNNELREGSVSKIATTEAELECFAAIKEQFENSAFAAGKIYDSTQRTEVPIQLSYRDTTGYFGVYFNRPGWWVARIVLGAKMKWIGFDLDPCLAESLLPSGMKSMSPSPWAPFRVAFEQPQDLHLMSRLMLASFRKVYEDRVAFAKQHNRTSPEALDDARIN